ncbi:hypothetical protein CBS101457_005751 [Exobasidium rhododendri]|nr:hypothetical protein CBS101457_005751 [Exobasidium rhododendri]
MAREAKEKSVSPTKGKAGVEEILSKARRDRDLEGPNASRYHQERVRLAVEAAAAQAKRDKARSYDTPSSEVDELEYTQDVIPPRDSLIINGRSAGTRISPTMSELELAKSPALMAQVSNGGGGVRDSKNGDVQEDLTLTEAVKEHYDRAGSDGSSETSVDSMDSAGPASPSRHALLNNDDDDDISTSLDSLQAQQERDRAQEQQEKDREMDEEIEESQKEADVIDLTPSSSSSSIGNDSDDEKDKRGKGEVEDDEEEDQIESTPVSAPRGSWRDGLSQMLGFRSSQDDRRPQSPLPPPTSAQRLPQLPPTSSTPLPAPSTVTTPSGLPRPRPRPTGGARLSQLDTTALKKAFSQPGTPVGGKVDAVGPSALAKTPTSAMKRKRDDDADQDSDTSSEEEEESDSDLESGGVSASLPSGKLAGQQKKPRTSKLAKMMARY